MKKENKSSTEHDAKLPVSGSFLCAHGPENRCTEQCYTCSEDEKCDVQYSYKHGILDTWKFSEWIGQHYIRLHECWVHRFSDQRNKDNWKDTGELWKLWWENYR